MRQSRVRLWYLNRVRLSCIRRLCPLYLHPKSLALPAHVRASRSFWSPHLFDHTQSNYFLLQILPRNGSQSALMIPYSSVMMTAKICHQVQILIWQLSFEREQVHPHLHPHLDQTHHPPAHQQAGRPDLNFHLIWLASVGQLIAHLWILLPNSRRQRK